MKRSRFIVGLLASAVIPAGCSRSTVRRPDGNIDYYTCTMHPSVRSKEPGKCPICGMNLVEVYKKTTAVPAAGAAAVSEFNVPVERQQQIGVTWALVEKRRLKSVIRVAGSVTPEGGLKAEFYEEDLQWLIPGGKAVVSLAAFPQERYDGTLGAVEPSLDPVKHTVRARIDLPDPKGILRPGMSADIELSVDEGNILSIPASAVLPTGKRFLVFVDRGGGRIEPRYARLGREFQSADTDSTERYYAVPGGLTAGERVVASGNFLIDAESKIQGAVQTWTGGSEENAK